MTTASPDCQLCAAGYVIPEPGPAMAGELAAPPAAPARTRGRYTFEASPSDRLDRWLARAYGPGGPGHSEDPWTVRQTDCWALALWDQLDQQPRGAELTDSYLLWVMMARTWAGLAPLPGWLARAWGRWARLGFHRSRKLRPWAALVRARLCACRSFRLGPRHESRWAALVAGPSWADPRRVAPAGLGLPGP